VKIERNTKKNYFFSFISFFIFIVELAFNCFDFDCCIFFVKIFSCYFKRRINPRFLVLAS